MKKRLLGLVLVLVLLAAFGSLSVLAAETAETNGDDTTLCELNLSYRTPTNVKTVELLDSDGSVISPDTPTTSMAKPAIYRVPKGEYRYKAYDREGLMLGAGSITVDSDTQTYQLFPMTAKSNVGRDITYTATLVETETGNVLEQGTPETETGEGTYFVYHWCPAVRIDFQGTQRSSVQYTYTVTPTDSKYAVESDILTIKLNSKIAPSGAAFYFNAKPNLEKHFYVTKNSNFRLFSKGNLHYVPFTEYIPDSIDTTSNPDYDIYTFKELAKGKEYHCTLGGVGTQYVRYCDIFRLNQADMDLWDYDKTDVYIDIEEHLNNSPDADYAWEANLYTNVNDAQYLQLDLDETFRLEAYRTWQLINSPLSNYFVEPDFHYEVIGDSITLEAGGAPGREYQTITPVKEGISVIKITYDAVLRASMGYADLYPEIDPVNTGIVIVNVGEKNDANIETNIDQTEFDTIYYISSTVEPTGETTPGTDHAEYTFTPTANDALTVRVHDPLHNTQWTDESAWTTYEANPDGSYTVDLKEGRNIIEVSAGEDVQYHVVNCYGLVITVENETNPGSALWLGDTGSVSFTGLSAPIQKMAAIYNPGFPDTEWVEYHDANGEVVRSKGVQYVVRAINTLKIEFTEAGEYVLSGGQIHCGHLGSALGAHRNIPENGLAPNLNASGGANSPYFSTLPDITITVRSSEAEAVIALIDAIGEVTLESGDAIEAAEGAYEALSEKEQVLVTNYEDLVAARKAYDKLVEDHAAADTVDALIDAIGTVTLRSGSAIETARTAYDALTEEQKGYVEHYKFLVAAEARYAELKRSGATPEDTTDEPKTSFPDVGGHWAADAIAYEVEKGLMNGTGGGMFSPDANTTRGMIVTILARLEGVDTAKGEVWYEAGRQWAMENGISDGTNMDGQITREQLATMLYRYAQIKGYDTTARTELSAFLDADSVSDWAQDAMQWAVAVGLVQGSDSRLTPAAPATRAQVATILMRLIENVAK